MTARTGVRDLVLLGAGGFARETAEAVRAINAVRPTWNLLGYLDDAPGRRGERVSGLEILGPMELVHELPGAAAVICTGRPGDYDSRRRIAERIGLADDRYATLVHPAATVGSTCRVGPGSVLLAHVDLTVDVTVGRHVAVMPQVVLTHDVVVEDFVTITSGVRLGGGSRVCAGAYLGSAAAVRDGVTIGERALLGMGAVATRHVPAGRLWYGNPARDRGPAPAPVVPAASEGKP